jgi:DNA-binding Lrp family transcriptional regulator
MVHAIVLLNVERDKVNDIAEQLASIKGVSEVFSVAGRLDLVALIRVRDNEELANIVTNQMRKIKGILSTETMLAFQVYSRHDLERIFSIGAE